jgi:hypothetical protein
MSDDSSIKVLFCSLDYISANNLETNLKLLSQGQKSRINTFQKEKW